MQPDRAFDFEPVEARALQWLPLAVRYKLDLCGLKIKLAQWQALALHEREALLRSAPGAGFEVDVLELVPAARRLADARGGELAPAFDDYLRAKRSASLTNS